MARDIENLPRPGPAQHLQAGGTTTNPRRVEQHRGLGGIPFGQKTRENLIGIARHIRSIVNAAGFLIAPGRPDGRSIQFNPHKTFHDIGHLQAKEAHPAVSVDQVPGSVTAQSFLHHPNQLGQQQEVILEKGMFRHLPARGFHAEDGLDPALGRRIASPLCDGLVDGRFGDHARLDVAHQATVGAYETQVQFLSRLVPLAADQDAVAIMVGVRTRDHRLDHGRIKPTNTPEELADLPVLPTELGGVVDVLVLAPPALTEISALRSHPLGGGCEDLHQLGPTETLLHLGELGLDHIARCGEGDKHHEFTHPADALPTKGKVSDFQTQPLAGDGQSVGQCFHPAELPRIGPPTKGRT